MLRDLRARHALLLQGPVGPFFGRFAHELGARGVRVTKVNFNAGDALLYRKNGSEVADFRGTLEEWPAFFRALVTERGIDSIFLFGDTRPRHQAAIAIAAELEIPVWVFEEGYLRPDYITLEHGGVNGNSTLPKDAAFYRQATVGLPELPAPVPVGNTFWHSAVWAALYSLAVTFFRWRYPHYRHHRDYNTFRQAFYWGRGGARKLWYALRERGVLGRLLAHPGGYFFVPLQVHCDAQLKHSDYRSMEQLIEEVVKTFAAQAPKERLLVFKHHPHDRPYRDYADYLAELGRRYGCGERLVYVHDLHLPTLLKHARGVVTMNSTVGTSALYHGTPVKVLGRAIYDIPSLTHQGPLADFFNEPGRVDAELFGHFCRWMREVNQVNGSFYKRVRGLTTIAGLDPQALPLLVSAPAE